MIRPALLALAGALALAACTVQTTPAGPTYLGETRERARLSAIAKDPTDAGTQEAVRQWAAHPDWEVAKYAVFAAIPSAAGPLEQRFSKLSADQQREILAHTSTLDGPEVSALVLRLSAQGGLVDEGIAALAGKQDAAAVQGLLGLASAGEESVRLQAVRALEPPDTAMAREGLLKLATLATEPGAVREAAMDVLAPYDTPEVRGGLMQMIQTEDSAFSAFALDRFDTARSVSELTIALKSTERASTTAAAVRLLNRAETLPEPVLQRFLALVDPSTFATDTVLRAGRFEAGKALVLRDDARGGPALVQLLDDDGQRAPAAEVLDNWLIDALPALRQRAPELTTGPGKAEAARLLVRTGGLDDEPLVAAMADPAEKAALLAVLPHAPYALFPSGKVSYVAAIDGLGAPTERDLHHVIQEGRKQRLKTDDPVLAYLGAARAYLAGARSKADQAALEKAAKAANDAFALWLRSSLKTGTWHTGEINTLTASRVSDRLRMPVRTDSAPTASYPGLALGGEVACTVKETSEVESLPSYNYNYTVLVPNPQKLALEQQVNSFPYDKRTITDCNKKCYCYVSGEGSREWNFSCESSSTGVGSCNCVEERKTYPNPQYESLVNAYNNEPALMEQNASVPLQRTKLIDVTTEACKGPMKVALGEAAHTGQISYQGVRRKWIVEGVAYPVHPDGTRLPEHRERGEPGETDNRKPNLESAVASALGTYSPSVDQVRAAYASAVKGAVAQGDVRAARDALVWSQPKLVATDAAGLAPFRSVWLSDAPGSFPAAWK